MSRLIHRTAEDVDQTLLQNVHSVIAKMPAGALTDLVNSLIDAGADGLDGISWFAMDAVDDVVADHGVLHSMRLVHDGVDMDGGRFDPYNDYFQFGPDDMLVSADTGTVEKDLHKPRNSIAVAEACLVYPEVAKQFSSLENMF